MTEAPASPLSRPASAALTREESAALTRRRRGRNIAMLIALLALSCLFYAIAIVKLGSPDLAR